jgi:CRISPR-associated protein Csa1
MYFLNDIEKKYLMNHLLKISRTVGVSDELRGWSWYKEPLKPYYDVRLPMYSICSKYCDTARDVYLRHVEKEEGEPTPQVELGSAVHSAVSSLFHALLEGDDFPGLEESDPRIEQVVEYVRAEAHAAIIERRTEQPYSTKRDILHTSLPFLVEHRISGRLLGLSELLSIDAFDYLRGILFDLKTGKERDFYKLYCTGYAMVFESVYEVPVDIGCTVYVDFRNENLHVRKDLFHISDDLRSWWIEERDNKLELVSTCNDPGKPSKCPESCMYYTICR